jgi:hypothetical protein
LIGAIMSLMLKDEDRRALDLLLDRGQAATSGVAMQFATADPAVQQRMAGVQKVLGMLDLMPGEEPALDLAARTLGLIDASFAEHPAALRALQPTMDAGTHA